MKLECLYGSECLNKLPENVNQKYNNKLANIITYFENDYGTLHLILHDEGLPMLTFETGQGNALVQEKIQKAQLYLTGKGELS